MAADHFIDDIVILLLVIAPAADGLLQILIEDELEVDQLLHIVISVEIILKLEQVLINLLAYQQALVVHTAIILKSLILLGDIIVEILDHSIAHDPLVENVLPDFVEGKLSSRYVAVY